MNRLNQLNKLGNIIGRRGGSAGPNGAPSNLVLTVVSDNGTNITIQLDWGSTSTDQDGYRIYKSEDGGLNYSIHSTTAGLIKQITDLVTGVFYKFKITAYKGTKESIASNIEEFFVGAIVLPNTVSTIENSVAHPSIVSFENAWNGYKYWMAATPYPGDNQEQPSIWASNNLVDWEVPAGLTNPVYNVALYPKPADCNIVYDPVLDKMVMYFMRNSAGETGLYRGTSSNGVTWSAALRIGDRDAYSNSVIILPDGSYLRYGSWTDGSRMNLLKFTSADGITWSAATTCTYPTLRSTWHQEVRLYDGIYYLITSETYGDASHGTEIYYYTSADGETFTPLQNYPVIDKHLPFTTPLTNKYYKPTFLLLPNGKFAVYCTEWSDYPDPWRIILFLNIELPFPSTRPALSLAYTGALPYILGDSFIRADTTTEPGNMTSGQAWSNVDAYRHMEIRSNCLIKDDNAAPGMCVYDIGMTDGYIVEARFKTDDYTKLAYNGIMVRFSTYLYHVFIGTAGHTVVDYGNLILTKVINGSNSTVLTMWPMKNNDIIGVKIIDNIYYIYKNNVLQGIYDDSAVPFLSDKTKVGIYIQNKANALRGQCDLFTVRNV